MPTAASAFAAPPLHELSQHQQAASAAAALGRPKIAACPVCHGHRLHYAFSIGAYRVVRCNDCRLMLLNPQPSAAELAQIYGEQYFIGAPRSGDGSARERVASMKAAT